MSKDETQQLFSTENPALNSCLWSLQIATVLVRTAAREILPDSYMNNALSRIFCDSM